MVAILCRTLGLEGAGEWIRSAARTITVCLSLGFWAGRGLSGELAKCSHYVVMLRWNERSGVLDLVGISSCSEASPPLRTRSTGRTDSGECLNAIQVVLARALADRTRRGLRSGSQITETRTFGFAAEIGAPVARVAGALMYVATCASLGCFHIADLGAKMAGTRMGSRSSFPHGRLGYVVDDIVPLSKGGKGRRNLGERS